MATPPFSLPTASTVRARAHLNPAQVDVGFPDAAAYESYITGVIADKASVVWSRIRKACQPYEWPLSDEVIASAMTDEEQADIDDEQAEQLELAKDATSDLTVAHLKREAGYYESATEYEQMANAKIDQIAAAVLTFVGRQEPQAPVTTYSSLLSRADGYAVAAASSDEYSQ